MAGHLRIGVWCDYGVTLTPTEGIGVFVWNLIGGLLEVEQALEIVILVRPGEQHLIQDLQKQFQNRLTVVPPVWPEISGSRLRTQVLQSAVRCASTLRRKILGLDRRLGYWRAKIGNRPASTVTIKVLGAVLWSLEFAKKSLVQVFGRGVIVLRRIPVFHFIVSELAAIINPVVVCQNARCDIWLIPSVRIRLPLTLPSVLVIHDLVHVHFPDSVPANVRWELEKLVPARAAEATLCACMSHFIRDTDLRGVLDLPAEKIRLIRPAPPTDFPELTHAEGLQLRPARLTRPYLFYPAAFRTYKNHSALIDALHLLQHSMGEDSFDLVFTGIHALPKILARKIINLKLKDHVHVLGCVDRRTLAALYQCAFATIVPSFYEQGSFPIYEALYWGCPVACSEIPSLVEQCEPLDDAMIYFDPHDPEEIARAILRIRDDREKIRARQQATKPRLWQRTWRDAARDWLTVFREAIELNAKQDFRRCA